MEIQIRYSYSIWLGLAGCKSATEKRVEFELIEKCAVEEFFFFST